MAQDLSGQAPGGKRTRLADALPLATPYVIQVFPVYACNLKCAYCIFSVAKSERGFIADKRLIDAELYLKCVDDMARFPQPIKVVRFVGIGEPLLHKKIVDMVAYTAHKGVARTIEIVTNGLLLREPMASGLIEAGLDRLVISVQGTTREKYESITGARVDFDRFLSDLDHLYRNRGKLHIYIKIVDTALTDEADRRRFHDLFGSRCDSIAVEKTVPIHKAIDFSGILKDGAPNLTQFGQPVGDAAVCPQPFFHMQINPDGKIVPCYAWDYPGIMGDCRNQSLAEIWNGEAFRAFRLAMLRGRRHAAPECGECDIIRYRWFPEDDLGHASKRLTDIFSHR